MPAMVKECARASTTISAEKNKSVPFLSLFCLLGCVEGFNNKAKVVTKRSYGVRTCDGLKIALYHALGELPTPKVAHRFC
jgi:hypothetical protein